MVISHRSDRQCPLRQEASVCPYSTGRQEPKNRWLVAHRVCKPGGQAIAAKKSIPRMDAKTRRASATARSVPFEPPSLDLSKRKRGFRVRNRLNSSRKTRAPFSDFETGRRTERLSQRGHSQG